MEQRYFFGQGGSTATSIDDDADNTWGGRAGPAIRTAPPVHTLHSPTFYDRIKALVPLFLAGGSSENPLDCIILTAFDQISKYLIRQWMVLHESIPVIPGFFHITYILNKGAAFGIMENQRWIF